MNPQLMPVQAVPCGVGWHWLPPPHTLGVPPPPHTSGEEQVPQGMTSPQPSATGPQAPAGQVVIGVHGPLTPPSPTPSPQTFARPPPPQVAGEMQPVPQLTRPPHPFAMLPQFIPAGHVVIGVQLGAPHWLGTPLPPQMVPPVHLATPQSTTPPHPSATSPHSLAPHEATDFGVHVPPSSPAPDPQTLGPPPPQMSGRLQVPQLVVTPPQPSGCGPHLPVKSAHVFGVQTPPPETAHLLGPPPPQNSGAVQPPQSMVPPQPSLWVPQFLSSSR
jgi:hypothetical protein